MNSHDVTDEQWEGLAQVVPLRGRNDWPSRSTTGRFPRRRPRRSAVSSSCGSGLRGRARGRRDLMAQIPVLLDLTGAETDVAKRILDFSSGCRLRARQRDAPGRPERLPARAGRHRGRGLMGGRGSRGTETDPPATRSGLHDDLAGPRQRRPSFVGRCRGTERFAAPARGVPSGHDRVRTPPLPAPPRPQRAARAPSDVTELRLSAFAGHRRRRSRSARSPCSPGRAAAASRAPCRRTRPWPGWPPGSTSTRSFPDPAACVPERAAARRPGTARIPHRLHGRTVPPARYGSTSPSRPSPNCASWASG